MQLTLYVDPTVAGATNMACAAASGATTGDPHRCKRDAIRLVSSATAAAAGRPSDEFKRHDRTTPDAHTPESPSRERDKPMMMITALLAIGALFALGLNQSITEAEQLRLLVALLVIWLFALAAKLVALERELKLLKKSQLKAARRTP